MIKILFATFILLTINQVKAYSFTYEKNNAINECEENMRFRIFFFSCIETVENYTIQMNEGKQYNIKLSEFKRDLKRLNRYVEISWGRIFNYNYCYATVEDLENDKMSWIKWYEQNKCTSIRRKFFGKV